MSDLSEHLITVCDNCLRASCWQGVFYCEKYKDAGITEKSQTELAVLDREHPRFWQPPPQLREG